MRQELLLLLSLLLLPLVSLLLLLLLVVVVLCAAGLFLAAAFRVGRSSLMFSCTRCVVGCAPTGGGNTTAAESTGPGGRGAGPSNVPGRHHKEATFVERVADVPELR